MPRIRRVSFHCTTCDYETESPTLYQEHVLNHLPFRKPRCWHFWRPKVDDISKGSTHCFPCYLKYRRYRRAVTGR